MNTVLIRYDNFPMKYHWHERYINLADTIAQWSEDRSTKVGAVAVDPQANRILSVGYNGFPRGVRDVEHRHERPAKYEYTEHAERNLIYNARGVDLTGSILYLNYYPKACADCVRGIIQSGVSAVIGCQKPFPGVGAGLHYDCTDAASQMLKESGVERYVYTEDGRLLPIETYNDEYFIKDVCGNPMK